MNAETLAHPRIHLPILSNSSRTTFQRCPREYQFRYVLNRKTRHTIAALKFGKFFHVGLNAWWTCNGAAHTKFDEALSAVAAVEGDHDAFDVAKARALLAGYTARWGEERLTTVAVEQMFRLPGELFDLGGSIDAICKDDAGRLHNVEHKTTSSDIGTGADYWRHIQALDPQVSTYSAAARSIGYPIHDTIYDVIRKPSFEPRTATPVEARKYTKPTKAEPIPRLYAGQRETDETPAQYGERILADIAESPAKYFARMTIVRLEGDDAAHARDVREVARMIDRCAAEDTWPRAPSACTRFGRVCDYFDVCSGLTTIDDDSQFESKVRTHEELSF